MGYRKYRRCKTNPLNRGFKERVIVSELTTFFQLEYNIDIVANKQVQGGSSKRRPDVLIDCDRYSIIVEIDERQHRSYSNYSNEINEQRVNDLINDLQGRKLVLIRFNPDAYKDTNRVLCKSLFSKTRGDRIYQIGCPKKYEERIKVLKEILIYYLNNEPQKPYIEHKLYYDKFDANALIIGQRSVFQ